MKAVWPGEPGGYVPVAWVDLLRQAQIKENAKAMHKKQEFFTNVKDAQLDAQLKRRKKK